MSHELFGLVEEAAVGFEHACLLGAEVFGYADHPGIEIAYPLHFVFFIELFILHEVCAFDYHEGIYAFALVFGDDSEDKADEFANYFSLEEENKQELLQPPEPAIEAFKQLVDVGQVYPHGYGFIFVIDIPDDFLVNDGFHRFEK
jgi:hypothetical protein